MTENAKGSLARHEPLLNRLAASDIELVIVIGPTDRDCACLDWVGAVLSVSGKNKTLPTVAQAIEDGLLHPGCRHHLVAYDPERVSAERASEARARTAHAIKAMRARARGEPPPPLAARHALTHGSAATDAAGGPSSADALTKFERVYRAAQKALAEGDEIKALVKCEAALSLLRTQDFYGAQQADIEDALQQVVRKLGGQ